MKIFFKSLFIILTIINIVSCSSDSDNNVNNINNETRLSTNSNRLEISTNTTNKSAVTDGRDYLGDFAPLFASINDDILFGQVWSREKELSPRDRSLITIAALMGAGVTDTSIKSHLEIAKRNGITKEEMVEVITQLSFYTGWTKGWSMFSFATEVYKE